MGKLIPFMHNVIILSENSAKVVIKVNVYLEDDLSTPLGHDYYVSSSHIGFLS